MDAVLQKVLKKLDEIDTRLSSFEMSSSQKKGTQDETLLHRAIEIVLSRDEVTQKELETLLKVDASKASSLMDEMARMGYGECVMLEC